MITELSANKRHALCAAATLAGLAQKSDAIADCSQAKIYEHAEYSWFDLTYEGKKLTVNVRVIDEPAVP